MTWRYLIGFVVVIVAAGVAWYFGARSCAVMLGTSNTESVVVRQIAWNGSFLVIHSRMLGLEKPDNSQALRLSVDPQHRLIALADGRSIVLGTARGQLENAGGMEPAFVPEPGDQVTFARGQGRLSWPTWFDFNFMTGNSASWKRFTTYRLVWKKPSGASLDLLWRFEQSYYPNEGRWIDADLTCDDVCGIVHAEISQGR